MTYGGESLYERVSKTGDENKQCVNDGIQAEITCTPPLRLYVRNPPCFPCITKFKSLYVFVF